MALLYPPGDRLTDRNSQPISAGNLFVYQNRTTSLLDIYSDPDLTVALANPVTLDGGGQIPTNVYIPDGSKCTLRAEFDDGAEAWTRDDCFGWSLGTGVDLASYGAVGDGVSLDTESVQAALTDAQNATLRVAAGTYLIDGVTVPENARVVCDPGAVFKRNSGASNNLITFSNGVCWEGGEIDGNRDNLAYSGGNRVEMYCHGDRIKVRDLTVKNAVFQGVQISGDRGYYQNINCEDCAQGFGGIRVTNAYINNIYVKRPNNTGFPSDVRGFGTTQITNSIVDGLTIDGMGGDAAVLSPTDALTAILFIDVYQCSFNNFRVVNCVGDLKHLCMSFVGAKAVTMTNFFCYQYAGPALEMIQADDTTLTNFIFDRRWQENNAVPDNSQSQVFLHATQLYDVDSVSGRDRQGVRTGFGVKLSNGVITRGGAIGVAVRQTGVTLNNVKISGIRGRGVQIDQPTPSSSYQNPASTPPSARIVDCEVTYCDGTGVSGRAGSYVVTGGVFNNNGQDTTFGVTGRAGINHNGGASVQRALITGAEMSDDQTRTIVDGVSFEPIAAASRKDLPLNDSLQHKITIIKPLPVFVGQHVNLINADGSGNVKARILELDRDEAIVSVASATTFSATGNTTALTGTWTSDGVNPKTLTGVDGAAATEIPGGLWITDGSEWRQVDRVTSDNAMVLRRAFTNALNSATLNKVEVDLHEIQSQHYGIWMQTASVEKLLLGPVFAEGNLFSNIITANVASRAGSQPIQADGFRSFNAAVADNAAVSFTPPVDSGLVIVTSDSGDALIVAYEATGTPSATLLSGTGTGAVTTGVLSGTTGADGDITVSAHTDGQIYLENRVNIIVNLSAMVISKPS